MAVGAAATGVSALSEAAVFVPRTLRLAAALLFVVLAAAPTDVLAAVDDLVLRCSVLGSVLTGGFTSCLVTTLLVSVEDVEALTDDKLAAIATSCFSASSINRSIWCMTPSRRK